MISKDAFTTIVVRFFTLIAGFATSILTARYLGPEGRGNYFFVITLVTLLTQFAHLGLASSNTYLVAQESKLLGKLIINSFWISLLLGIITAIITLVILDAAQPYENTGTWVLLPLVPITIFYLLGTNLLIGINKISVFNFFQITSSLLIVCLMLIAGLSGKQVNGFLIASLIGWGIIAILLLYKLMHYAKHNEYRLWFDKSIFARGASFGLKAYIATLMGFLVLKGNIFLLKYYSNEIIMGYYSVAAQLNDCIIIIPTSIGLVLFPKLIRNNHSRWEEMRHSLILTALMMFITCILAAVLVKPFIQITFGNRFLPATSVFWCLLPGGYFLGMISIISQYIAANGFSRLLVAIWCLAVLIVTLSSWILIPLYAGNGAAIALSITYFVLFCLILLLAKHQKNGGLIEN